MVATSPGYTFSHIVLWTLGPCPTLWELFKPTCTFVICWATYAPHLSQYLDNKAYRQQLLHNMFSLSTVHVFLSSNSYQLMHWNFNVLRKFLLPFWALQGVNVILGHSECDLGSRWMWFWVTVNVILGHGECDFGSRWMWFWVTVNVILGHGECDFGSWWMWFWVTVNVILGSICFFIQ